MLPDPAPRGGWEEKGITLCPIRESPKPCAPFQRRISHSPLMFSRTRPRSLSALERLASRSVRLVLSRIVRFCAA